MLKFRRIVEDDLEKLIRWRTTDFITKYLKTEPTLDMESQIKWYNRVKQDPTCQHWVVTLDDFDIGVINLSEIDARHSRCFWGYYIAEPEARGKGISYHMECNLYDYGFFVFGLHKMSAEILAYNEIGMYIGEKKSPSEPEGVFKKHFYKDGQYYDLVRIALLKERWEEIRHTYHHEDIYIEAPGL